VDDLNRYMWVDVIPSTNRVVAAIMEIQARAEGESSPKLMVLRIDHGGGFTARQFVEYCTTKDMHDQHTTPYNIQWNGTVVTTARSMLKAKGLPGWFWGEAGMKSVDGMTPFEAWHEKKPVVHYLRTFGCILYV
jgi:hypothetical protein